MISRGECIDCGEYDVRVCGVRDIDRPTAGGRVHRAELVDLGATPTRIVNFGLLTRHALNYARAPSCSIFV